MGKLHEMLLIANETTGKNRIKRFELAAKYSMNVLTQIFNNQNDDTIILEDMLMTTGSCLMEATHFLSAAEVFSFMAKRKLNNYQKKEILEMKHNCMNEGRPEKLETREDWLQATYSIIWDKSAVNTLEIWEEINTRWDTSRGRETILTYLKDLRSRRLINLWGGPQGRLYSAYLNVDMIPFRKSHYGKPTMITGEIQSDFSNYFFVDNISTWKANYKFFIVNGGLTPNILLAVEYDIIQDPLIRSLLKVKNPISAFGTLNRSSEFLTKKHYEFTGSNLPNEVLQSGRVEEPQQKMLDYYYGAFK